MDIIWGGKDDFGNLKTWFQIKIAKEMKKKWFVSKCSTLLWKCYIARLLGDFSWTLKAVDKGDIFPHYWLHTEKTGLWIFPETIQH